MNITVFGAAFDPPHRGHQKIVDTLLSQKLADEVWLLPVKIHAFGKEMSSDQDRLAMLNFMIQPQVRIETYELDLAKESITYQTLCALREKYPEHKFSFVIGADNLARFDEWDDYEQMLAEFPFYVYPRQGYSLDFLRDGMKVLEGVETIKVSSTQVKELVSHDQPISDFVDPRVLEYITHHKLYR